MNLSLDTLDPEKYAWMTRGGDLRAALRGLEAALEAGFEKIKINAVLIGGWNEKDVPALAGLTEKQPVDVRFIELMPMPESGGFPPEAFIPAERVLDQLPQAKPAEDSDGVARMYRLPGALGRVGLISPVSRHFCGTCNRLRLTADGHLKPCLHSREEVCIKGMNDEEMRAAMEQAIRAKPWQHAPLSPEERSQSARPMNRIGG